MSENKHKEVYKMDEFDITEGGTTEIWYLTRKTDGRGFTCICYYDPTLDYKGEIIVEAHDEKPVTKEEEEAVKRAIHEYSEE